jgi:hypothetical protein
VRREVLGDVPGRSEPIANYNFGAGLLEELDRFEANACAMRASGKFFHAKVPTCQSSRR